MPAGERSALPWRPRHLETTLQAPRIKHLQRRNRTYYLRLPVPLDLRAAFARRELNYSLRTTCAERAAGLALAGTLAFRRMCDTIRTMTVIDQAGIRDLVRRFHAERVAQARPPAPHDGSRLERTRAWAEDAVEGRIDKLETLVREESFDIVLDDDKDEAAVEVRTHATRLAATADIAFDKLNEVDRLALMSGVARALVEEHRLFLHQLSDRLAPYTPRDALFAALNATRPAEALSTSAEDVSLRDAIDAFVTAHKGVAWSPKTLVDYERVMRWMTEHFGADAGVASITQEQVRDWRDKLVAMRKHAPPGAHFSGLQTSDAKKHVSRVTAAKHFGFSSSAFRWWAREGYIAASPVGGITVKMSKANAATSRTPFTPAELEGLFTSPIYVGCAGRQRRTTPGTKIYRDDFYWVPIIGALSGMRLGEIVQLGLGDVVVEGDAPHFDIRADVATKATVKSKAGWRTVPMHRRLIELGLLEFVGERQAAKKDARLFHLIRYGSDGSPSGEYSRWFARRLAQLGLKRPGLVFHSFRHGFIDALREVNCPGYVLKAIVGHEQGGVTDGYGQGATLKQKREWVDKIDLLEGLPPAN